MRIMTVYENIGLIKNYKYVVEKDNEKCIGTYKGPNHNFVNNKFYILWDVTMHLKMAKIVTQEIHLKMAIFDINDKFYCITTIKEKAKHARQKMEKRALDKILKQLVNDDFKW